MQFKLINLYDKINYFKGVIKFNKRCKFTIVVIIIYLHARNTYTLYIM